MLSVSERRDFNYFNYAQEKNVSAALGRGTCPQRYTFITANLLQGLNIIGKIQNMTSALNRLTKIRIAMSSMEGTHLSNMVSALVLDLCVFWSRIAKFIRPFKQDATCFQTRLDRSDASPYDAVIRGLVKNVSVRHILWLGRLT